MPRRTVAFLLALAAGADLPSEIRLFAMGANETTKGTFWLTPEGAARVMEGARAWGNRFSFDYDHATFDPAASPADHIAAGWFDLELRDDGLWAASIEWTPRAAEALRNREWRYHSPAFDTETDAEGREVIVRLWNGALTNIPATRHQPALVASRAFMDRRTETTSLRQDDLHAAVHAAVTARWFDAWIVEVWNDFVIFGYAERYFRVAYAVTGSTVALAGDATEVARSYTPVQGGISMKTVLTRIGLAPDAAEAQALERVTALTDLERDVLAATGEASVEAARGTLAAFRASHEQVAALRAQLERVEGERRAERLAALVARGRAERKLTPALEEWAAAQTPEALAAFLEKAPAVQALAAPEAGEPAEDGRGGALSWEGRPFDELRPAERASLAERNPALYAAMRADWVARGKPLAKA